MLLTAGGLTPMTPTECPMSLFGDALDKTRQRVQQETLGHRGRTGDPLYGCRRLLRTALGLLKQHQLAKLETVFDAHPDHVAVEVTWDIYQRAIAAYRHDDPARGKKIFERVIAVLSSEVPRDLPELISLGRTITRRAKDILAFFDHPGTSNGPSEALNGRLEHLRGTALGFRNLTHYIARSLLEAGGFRPQLHAQMR
ncbi:transposase [Microbacterium amylolyticum]|uniref:Transposase n=1 Tax=Microbacterium amylolyticum TaxID=936337 RepID=A0ABS4ZI34_9MICO|nr:transposase [Microbacterium amylolyticum]